MNNSASASRRTWNRVMNALVWASAVLVIALVLFVFIMGINILLNVVLKGGKRDE